MLVIAKSQKYLQNISLRKGKTVEKVTLSEAKNHYKSHTRHVTTDDARRRLKNAVWYVCHDKTPLLIGDGLTLRFMKNDHGHTYAHATYES